MRTVEAVLWNSRFITLIAVIGSFFASLVMFYVACIDIGSLARVLAPYATHAGNDATHQSLRTEIISYTVEIVDTLLFGLVLLIFALGIYELFINKIEAIERSESASRVLLIRSLDELKERLAKVILLILIVNYFEYAIELTPKSSLDLLFLAAGVLLVAFGIYLTRTKPSQDN